MPNDPDKPADISQAVPYGDELIEPAREAGPESPNILMIFSDEHHWGYSGFNGHPIARTPNLDRLARQGVNFTQAYCNSPLCSPSRQSFMAGQYPHKIGAWNNCCAMPENTVTWAHALGLAGYETLLCGKMHFNGYQKLHGFDRRPVKEGNTDGVELYSYGVRTSHDWTRPLPYRCGSKSPIAGAGVDTPDRQSIVRPDRQIVAGTIREILERGRNPSGRPWALCCGTILPHPPFLARQDLFDSYAGKVDLPVNWRGENLGEVDRAMRTFYRMDAGAHTEAEILRARQAYYALITEFDEYVGRILDALTQSGQAEKTIILYFSDHGEMAGEHGMIAKCSLREASARVPLIVSRPGRYAQGATVETPVSLVDLYPTLLDMAGGTLPSILADELDGHSLLPLLEGRPEEFRGQGVFCEFEGEGWNHPRAFLRDGNLKYVFNHTAPHELYDLQTDPQELCNLAGNPAYAQNERALRNRILGFWDPAAIERAVLRTQARQKIAYCRNVCLDQGW